MMTAKPNPKPFHPAGLLPGGVSVSGRQVVLRHPVTAAVMAQSLLPAGVHFEGESLFSLFPDDEWTIGEAWQGQVDLRLIRLERQRQIDGAITFNGTDGPYAWTAEVVYGESGPMWEIDVPLPAGHTPLDIGLRLALGEAIYDIIGGPPAAGRPGETVSVEVNNSFTREHVYEDKPFRLRYVDSTPQAVLAKLWEPAGMSNEL